MKRREFIVRLIRGLIAGAVAWLWPASRGAAAKPVFDLGRPCDHPPGSVKHLIFEEAFLISDEEGIYALSSICTHLGGPLFKTDKNDAFVCRWHHSRFDLMGDVVRGPATRPLPWIKLVLTRAGHLELHRAEAGEKGLKVGHWKGVPSRS